MGSLWERLDETDNEARLRGEGGLSVAEVLDRLEQGKLESGDLAPADIVACLALGGLGPSDALGPALVQQPPSHPGLRTALDESALSQILPGTARPARLALSAGLLLIHDFWDASHEAAQVADDLGEPEFSAYWHGIAHRREPDAGNAAYWFRRVGRHRVFGPLAREAALILPRHNDERWTTRLLSSGGWNSQAMIELCSSAPPGSDQEALARQLQRLEMQLLLEANYDAVATG